MALQLQVGQTAELTFLPYAVGIHPNRIEEVRWAPVGPDSTKVDWGLSTGVKGTAPGSRTFKVTVILKPLTMGEPQETVSYEFDVTCVPAGWMPAPVQVPATLTNIV